MVEISLHGLSVSFSFAGQMDELIESSTEGPHLVLCAERLTIKDDQAASSEDSYLSQAWKLAHVGYRCPLIVLQDQSSALIHPETLEGGLPLVASLRKPFKTHDLLKTVCEVMAWEVPHGEVLLSNSRVIPLARPPIEPNVDVPAELSSSYSVSTPTPTSVGSLIGEVSAAETPAPPLPQAPAVPTPPAGLTPPPLPPTASVSTKDDQSLLSGSITDEVDLSPSTPQSVPPPKEVKQSSPPSLGSAPPPSQPSADESFRFEFPDLAGPPPVIDEGQVESDDLSPPFLAPVTETSHRQNEQLSAAVYSEAQPAVDEEEDWLDDNGVTVSTPAIGSQPPPEHPAAHVEAPVGDLIDQGERSSSALETEWLSTLEKSVRDTSDRALEVVTKLALPEESKALSNAEIAILIERVAWEIVPSIARDLLQEQLVQTMSDQS